MIKNEIGTLSQHPDHPISTDFFWMTLPPFAMALYLYGARVAALCLTALVTANLCDRIVALLRGLPYDKTESSSMPIAMVLTLLLPASVPYYVVMVSVAAAVLLGKAAFGGYGVYPFNPSALGFAIAAVSWPDEVFRYPTPFTDLTIFSTENATLVDGAAHTLRAGGVPNINLLDLILGNYAGSMGASAALVLVACALYLWMRKRITLAAPLGFLATYAALAYLFPRLGDIGLSWPWHFVRLRLLMTLYELLSGAVLFAAVFLVNEPVTIPKSGAARLAYGVILGIVTMLFRYYGTYDLSVCFAVLCVNILSGWLDRVFSRRIVREEVRP